MSYFDEYIKPQVEHSISLGCHIYEYVQSNEKSQKDHIDNIHHYVAKNGKYTPYVSYVDIYYPLDILKEVTFVDTPGTNDPNPSRSRMTEEWINQSHANIYVAYANQALDRQDIEFIDKYLFGVSTSSRITAINKIDLVDNIKQLQDWVSEVSQQPHIKAMNIFNEKEIGLVHISALGGLIDKILSKGKSLNENLDFYAERLDGKGFLEPNKHGIDALLQSIEELLLKNKGRSIIESHKSFIDGIIYNKIKWLEFNVSDENNKLQFIGEDESILRQKQALINKDLKDAEVKLSNILDNCRIVVETHISKLGNQIFESKTNIANKLKTELNSYTRRDQFRDTGWNLKNFVEGEFRNIFKYVTKMINEMSSKSYEIIDQALTELNMKEGNSIGAFLEVSTILTHVNASLTEIKDQVDKQFSVNTLDTKTKDYVAWYKRMFSQTFGVDDLRNKIYPDLIEKLDVFFDESFLLVIKKEMKLRFREGISNKISGVYIKRIRDLQKTIELLIKDSQAAESMRKDILKIIGDYEKVIEQIHSFARLMK